MRLDCKSRRTGALLPLGVPDIKRAICPYSPFCRICNPTSNKISGFTIRLIWFLFYWITNPYNNCVWIANPDELSGKAGSIGKTLSPFCRICNPTSNKISGFTIRLICFLLYWITNPYNECVWIANPDERGRSLPIGGGLGWGLFFLTFSLSISELFPTFASTYDRRSFRSLCAHVRVH